MIDPRAKYQDALAAFSHPGCRWQYKGALTYWGKAAGLTADDIISDARAAGVTDRDSDIRRGWNDARPRSAADTANYSLQPRAKDPKPPQHPNHVRTLIDSVTANCGFDSIRAMSPCRLFFGGDPKEQTRLFLEAAFRQRERLHIFRNDRPVRGEAWTNIREAGDWIDRLPYETLPGDLIVPNPLTGLWGETTLGQKSLIAQSCIAAFPFLVMEFDDLPLELQCRFWCGFIRRSNLAPSLVSLTFSGNRSIHGLLHVGCGTLDGWKAVRCSVCRLFASDTDKAYQADRQAMQPRTGTRIPGVCRLDNGRLQELLYLNPEAREGTLWRDCERAWQTGCNP